ncbi:hypothetical protein [Rhodococcus sp. UFZ-B548]|uniref:hypothetical protein n=1 Tax=Rhodococcus sp. UFZ-B548 TaxID=2742212 RepID=UPI0015F5E5B3|nr:hypothetical protein [Rhodococcus sp. UFZ-B548]
MTTLREQLDNCNYLLARARTAVGAIDRIWLAGNGDAVRRFSEHRDKMVKQIASTRTHLRAV